MTGELEDTVEHDDEFDDNGNSPQIILGSVTPPADIEGTRSFGGYVAMSLEKAREIGWSPGRTMTFDATNDGRTYRYVGVTGEMKFNEVVFRLDARTYAGDRPADGIEP